MSKTTIRVGNALSFVLAVALAFSAGCKDKGVLGDGGRETMSQYATGYNEILGTVPNFLTAYFGMAEDEGIAKGKVPTSTSSICMFNVGVPLDKVKPAFEAAKSSAGKDLAHLGPLSDDVLAAVTDIETARASLCKYLEAEDYKDDDFKLAKELHGKIADGAERYQKSFKTFSAALDEIEDKQVLDQIKKYEGTKNASYWYRNFTHQSKVLLKATNEPATYDAAYDAWLVHYEGLSKYTAESKGKINASFDSYQKQADRFAADAKKLRRALDEAKTDEEKQEAAGKANSSLVSTYNSMLSFHEGFASLEEYSKLNSN